MYMAMNQFSKIFAADFIVKKELMVERNWERFHVTIFTASTELPSDVISISSECSLNFYNTLVCCSSP